MKLSDCRMLAVLVKSSDAKLTLRYGGLSRVSANAVRVSEVSRSHIPHSRVTP